VSFYTTGPMTLFKSSLRIIYRKNSKGGFFYERENVSNTGS